MELHRRNEHQPPAADPQENIPNAKDIFPALWQRDAWVKGYGVPFDGGLYLPVYSPKATGFTPTSWKDVMKPELHEKLTLDQAFYYGLYAAAYISDMYAYIGGQS